MKTLCASFIAASLVAVPLVYGQNGTLAGPSIGFVFDSSAHSLRRVQGLPGAALVGAPLEFGFVLSSAFVAPGLDSAFVLSAEGVPHFFQIADGVPAERTLELASFQQVVYSPSGTAAALLSPGKFQVVKGLPDHPVIAGTLSPRANPAGRRSAPPSVAVSDDGAYLLYGNGGVLELLGLAGDSRLLLDAAPGALAAFAPGNHDAAVLQNDKLIIFNNIAGSSTSRRMDPVAAPSALAFSPDSRNLFVASATGRNVTIVRLDTGERTSLPCDCAPSSLTRMGSLFRLNELGKDPLWLLESAGEVRSLIFVPSRQ
ncbi:MAG: hypothetical protein ABI759_06630 [Candidatus Solibacter sp.]